MEFGNLLVLINLDYVLDGKAIVDITPVLLSTCKLVSDIKKPSYVLFLLQWSDDSILSVQDCNRR